MRWRIRRWLGLLAGAVVLCACSDSSPSPGTATTSAGGSGGSGAGGTMAVAPGEPEPLPVAQWMVAAVNVSSDPIVAAMNAGTFELPPAGEYLGLDWAPVVPGENGKLIDTSKERLYAVARVTLPEGRHLFARGDTVIAFYTDNVARHPGDFYHSKKMRTPLAVHGGEHLIVVRALGQRNTPEVELWSTRAELVFNASDTTSPDLIVGDKTERPLGMAVLNTSGKTILDLRARVLESDVVEETEWTYPSLAPDAVTQLSFLIRPKVAPSADAEEVRVTLELNSPGLDWAYEQEVVVPVVPAGARFRQTRLSLVDASTQYQGVVPPVNLEPQKSYGLFLSLHGAGVEAKGQAAAYGQMPWAYVVAPTNRRPYGFDWEEWGRLDAMEALESAIANFPIDTTRLHLTGHSMGGHGTWHNGVHFGHRFGMIAPSAAWIAFDTYGGGPFPEGVVGRARAASMTLDFVDNLASNAVYMIHGSSDTNVPISQAKQMQSVLEPIVSDLTLHTEPGAGHWWDNDPDEPGVDCVDFQPMIDKAEGIVVDPLPLNFSFTTPGSWVSSKKSFLRVRSCESPLANCSVQVSETNGVVAITTNNVRSLQVDGAALLSKKMNALQVDEQPQTLVDGPIDIGPTTGKTPNQHGPINQVFHKPFCFVWSEAASPLYRHYVSWLLSWWSVIGNGHGCGVPLSALSDTIRKSYNLVFVGVPLDEVDKLAELPVAWSESEIVVGGKSFSQSALAFVFPYEDKLYGYWAATQGHEELIFRYTPFSSRAGMPDFLIFDSNGIAATGFFDADWKFNAAYSEGL